MTVLGLPRVNGCSECDERCQQMPLHWDNRGPAPAVVEEGGKLQCKSTNSRKLFKDELDVDDNTYGGVYILFRGIRRFIVYFVVISCLAHHLMFLNSNLCSEKVECSLLGQVSKNRKDLLFLTRIFSFICWGVRQVFLPSEQ